MTIAVDSEGDHPPIATLIGTLDQAALHGLLRRLYSLGLPLISVICVEHGSKDSAQVGDRSKIGNRDQEAQ
jgi:hypothetical protein